MQGIHFWPVLICSFTRMFICFLVGFFICSLVFNWLVGWLDLPLSVVIFISVVLSHVKKF